MENKELEKKEIKENKVFVEGVKKFEGVYIGHERVVGVSNKTGSPKPFDFTILDLKLKMTNIYDGEKINKIVKVTTDIDKIPLGIEEFTPVKACFSLPDDISLTTIKPIFLGLEILKK